MRLSPRPTLSGPGCRLALPLGLLVVLALLVQGCGLTSTVTDYLDSRDGGLRKRVAVAPFTSGVASLKGQAALLQKSIEQRLVSQGVASVPFAVLQAEMDKVPKNVVNAEDRAIEAGRQIGINAVLAGNLTDLSIQRRLKGIYGFRDNVPFLNLEAELRLLDVTTGTVIGQESFKRQEEVDDVEGERIETGGQPPAKLVEKLMAEITKDTGDWVAKQISMLPWGGVVLALEPKRIKVAGGRDSGLSVGNTLVVYGLGEHIKAGTGQDLVLPGPKVAKIRISELGDRYSWATIEERFTDPKLKAKDKDKDKETPPVYLEFEVGQYVRTR